MKRLLTLISVMVLLVGCQQHVQKELTREDKINEMRRQIAIAQTMSDKKSATNTIPNQIYPPSKESFGPMTATEKMKYLNDAFREEQNKQLLGR